MYLTYNFAVLVVIFGYTHSLDVECSSYTVLNSSSRAQGVPRGNITKCDDTLIPGWYRFMGDAGTAMPTSCTRKNYCGTDASGWMQGSHPTQTEGIVTRRVCYHWNSNCCNWNNNIRVRNCGGFYVYELVRPPNCHLRYCGNGTDAVRIQGGGSSGRLQVFHNGVWGTVCDDYWSMTNTHVVCRQLGFAGALSHHNSGGGTGQIWLDDVQCSGNESAIQQCRHNGWGRHDCSHSEDVFVTCYRDVSATAVAPTAVAPTTASLTAVAPATASATAVAPATVPPTAVAPTTASETAVAPTTAPVTAVAPTTAPATAVAPTTASAGVANTTTTAALSGLTQCNSHPCRNEGSCHGDQYHYYCNCYHGFTGKQCETRFYGNITFTMDLYQTSNYSTPYSPSAYPVVVHPNQSLWVQYEVKSTTFDLVVFAENCRANNSTNPDSFPQHVFLERGCIVDSTMVYFHNPYSKVQRFSIRSFRFAYSNSHLVYLHCELLVCHQNSTNSRSRCAVGCTKPRSRRDSSDLESSMPYNLSVGPLKAVMAESNNVNKGGKTSFHVNTILISVLVTAGVFSVITLLLLIIIYRNCRRDKKVEPASCQNEQENGEKDESRN